MKVDSKGELGDDRTGKAYACVWGVRDTYGTVWVKGCFAKSIRERGPGSEAKQKIVMLWQHDTRDPIGRITSMEEDDYGLLIGYALDDGDSVPSAKRAHSQIKSGTINGWSFGFDWIWDKLEYEEKTDSILVREAELFEISPVTFPSINQTYSLRAKVDFESAKFQLSEDTEELIKSLPRAKQLEARSILTRHITLAKIQPDELRQTSLETELHEAEGLQFSKLLNCF